MKIINVLLLHAILLTSVTKAETIDSTKLNDFKEKDHFNVRVLFTGEIGLSEKFLSKPEQPNLIFNNEFKVEEPYEVVILFAKFKTSKDGKSDIKYTFKMYDPSNKKIFEKSLQMKSDGIPSHDVILVDPQFVMTGKFNKSEPKGKYTVTVDAEDLIGGGKSSAKNIILYR